MTAPTAGMGEAAAAQGGGPRVARGRGGRQDGYTLLELAIAAAVLTVVVGLAVSALATGMAAHKLAEAEEVAVGTATRLVQHIARELKDARASNVVFSAAAPDRITFRRMVGYNQSPLSSSSSDGVILSPPITYQRVAAAGPRDAGPYHVERCEPGRPTVRVAAYVAECDLDTPALPGLRFDVRDEDGGSGGTGSAGDGADGGDGGGEGDDGFQGGPCGTLVEIAVTVEVPDGRGGLYRVRRSTMVHLEVD